MITNHDKKTHIIVGVQDTECDEIIAIIDAYQARKNKQKRNIIDAISVNQAPDLAFEPERIDHDLLRDTDFS